MLPQDFANFGSQTLKTGTVIFTQHLYMLCAVCLPAFVTGGHRAELNQTLRRVGKWAG